MRLPVMAGLAAAALFIGACGSKQPDETAKKPEPDTAAEQDTEDKEKKAAVDGAKKQIQSWISEDLTKKFTTSGVAHGKALGQKLAQNGEVIGKAKKLSGNLLKDESVKPKLDKIEDKATAGFGKKLTLGWKVLKQGGISNFKKKVSADAQRVAMDVLAEHLKNDILKDERASELLKVASPVLKIQGKIAAIALQENLSPKVTQKILSIALRIAAAGQNSEIASRVENWISTCQQDATEKIDKLMAEVFALQSLEDAITGLTTEVLEHPRTKKELLQMINTLLDDPQINSGLIKVYEAAAFEKGDAVIKDAMVGVIRQEAFDTALFETLTRLAEAPGAGDIIGKHLTTVGEDPKLAAIVEDFILSILDTCGDPSNT